MPKLASTRRFCAVMLSTSVVFGCTPTSVANCFSSASFSEACAFEAAGTDYLYAQGLKTIPEMKQVMDAVSTPLNIVMGFANPIITSVELAEIAVRARAVVQGVVDSAASSGDVSRTSADLDAAYARVLAAAPEAISRIEATRDLDNETLATIDTALGE